MVLRDWPIRIILLCLGIYAALARGQESSVASPYDCRAMGVPTSWAFDNPPGLIEAHNAIFTDAGDTTVELVFRNDGTSPLLSLAMVMEYVDAQEEVIDRIPIVAAVKPGIREVPPNVLSPADAWKRALPPGEAVRLVGTRDGIRTGQCPVRARVTFASVRFPDGTTRTFSSPGWRLPATPKQVPILPEAIPEFPAQPPTSVLAKLKISASGDVIDVVSEEAVDHKVVDWIRDRMRDWKFHPALVGGKPADSELTTLFLIHAKGMGKFSEERPVLQPVTLIQFIWSRDLSQTAATDRWTVMYGWLTEGSVTHYPMVASTPKTDNTSK